MTGVAAERAGTALVVTRAVLAVAARTPLKPAIVSEGLVLDYSSLALRVRQVAAIIEAQAEYAPGARVAIACRNRAEYFEAVLGVAHAGGIAVTLNPAMAIAEFRSVFADCRPCCVMVDHPADTAARTAGESRIEVIAFDGEYPALLAKSIPAGPDSIAAEDDGFLISYTSGTTGTPKGVILSHRSRALTAMAMAAEYRCFTRTDTFLGMTPLFHGAGFAYPYAILAAGGTLELMPKFDAAQVWARLASGVVTGTFVVPTIVARLVAEAQARGAAPLPLVFATMICNAAALTPQLKLAMTELLGAGRLHETYGSTEAGIVTNMPPEGMARRPASVGLPFQHMEVEIRRDDGSIAAPGEPGELFARGPYSFNGYFADPGETEAAIRSGWITVGDVAVRDDEGYITIVDRKKDMIISGGINIYPREIERVLEGFVDLVEVAVVGLPDPEWGERVHAFCVVRGGGQGDAEALDLLCRRALTDYKRPKGYSWLAELPRNSAGKVVKRALRELMK